MCLLDTKRPGSPKRLPTKSGALLNPVVHQPQKPAAKRRFETILHVLSLLCDAKSFTIPLHSFETVLIRCMYRSRLVENCCNLSAGVALNVQFTTNGMCVKNNTPIYVARTSNNRVISSGDLYCCLLPQCEALRTCHSGFPIATEWWWSWTLMSMVAEMLFLADS